VGSGNESATTAAVSLNRTVLSAEVAVSHLEHRIFAILTVKTTFLISKTSLSTVCGFLVPECLLFMLIFIEIYSVPKNPNCCYANKWDLSYTTSVPI